jgi:hypothetical protein
VVRHRAAFLRRYRPGRHVREIPIRIWVAGVAAVLALATIGAVTWSDQSPAAEPETAAASAPAIVEMAERMRGADSAATRSHKRAAPQHDSAPSAQKPSAQKPSASPSPEKPQPVAGLSQSQMDNAIAIVETGKQMKLPRRAMVVAIATALQESELRNLANSNLPESMDRPNQGVGRDHDSVGLFQQRPNWGSVDELMNPKESARRFYDALVKIPGWEQMNVTYAAQSVQRSAFPDAYAKHQGRAERIVDAID